MIQCCIASNQMQQSCLRSACRVYTRNSEDVNFGPTLKRSAPTRAWRQAERARYASEMCHMTARKGLGVLPEGEPRLYRCLAHEAERFRLFAQL